MIKKSYFILIEVKIVTIFNQECFKKKNISLIIYFLQRDYESY